MRSTFSFLLAFAPQVLTQDFGEDYRTVSDCIQFVHIENATEETCEATLREWNLEPVRFHAWNPSVGLDCTPWPDDRSYCVLNNATVWDSVNSSTMTTTLRDEHYTTLDLVTYTVPLPVLTTDSAGWTIPVTRSDAPARPANSRAPVPSPDTWTDMGCFVDTWNEDDFEWPLVWILDYRFVPKQPDETLDKCKQKCWEIAYPIAGVKSGNECFCGDRNNGTRAEDQGDCNTPCVGDQSVMCGGTNRTSIWGAEEYVQNPATATAGSGVGAGSASRTDASGTTATATSGARRNAVPFWRM